MIDPDLLRIMADNDQDRATLMEWMAEMSESEQMAVWDVIQTDYDDPCMEVMSRFAQLAFGEIMIALMRQGDYMNDPELTASERDRSREHRFNLERHHLDLMRPFILAAISGLAGRASTVSDDVEVAYHLADMCLAEEDRRLDAAMNKEKP